MKKALIVGINHYELNPLTGSIHDAELVHQLLQRNADGSPNFDCRLIVSSQETVNRELLLTAIEELFEGQTDTTLLFFAGNGGFSKTGGCILSQEANSYHDGISMREIQALAGKSSSRECIIVLDCCHSGTFGELMEGEGNQILIREGMSILAATRAEGKAEEIEGQGVFSALLCAALGGGAADLLGRVTIASVYAYIDRALGAWHQRPSFKAHLSTFSSLRNCKPHLDDAILRLLPEYFETPDQKLQLNISFEPSESPHDEKNERTFRHLQQLRDVRLLVPEGETALYYAAVNGKACKLTPLGRYYWQLAKDGRI